MDTLDQLTAHQRDAVSYLLDLEKSKGHDDPTVGGVAGDRRVAVKMCGVCNVCAWRAGGTRNTTKEVGHGEEAA